MLATPVAIVISSPDLIFAIDEIYYPLILFILSPQSQLEKWAACELRKWPARTQGRNANRKNNKTYCKPSTVGDRNRVRCPQSMTRTAPTWCPSTTPPSGNSGLIIAHNTIRSCPTESPTRSAESTAEESYVRNETLLRSIIYRRPSRTTTTRERTGGNSTVGTTASGAATLKSIEFMRMTEPIWQEMTTHLQALFPLAYKEVTSIPLESHLRRMCGAWMGCVVSHSRR
jgi:hypothetical protein